jgi:hypothetical protein
MVTYRIGQTAYRGHVADAVRPFAVIGGGIVRSVYSATKGLLSGRTRLPDLLISRCASGWLGAPQALMAGLGLFAGGAVNDRIGCRSHGGRRKTR